MAGHMVFRLHHKQDRYSYPAGEDKTIQGKSARVNAQESWSSAWPLYPGIKLSVTRLQKLLSYRISEEAISTADEPDATQDLSHAAKRMEE